MRGAVALLAVGGGGWQGVGMDPMEINDEKLLGAWLFDKPNDWMQSIALRAALRVFPYIGASRRPWLEKFALLPIGALITSWIQLTENSIDIFKSGSRANARFAGEWFDFAGYKDSPLAAMAADVSYHSADAQTRSMHLVGDCIKAVSMATETFRSVAERRQDWGDDEDRAADTLWFNVQLDCARLSSIQSPDAGKALATVLLWSGYDSKWSDDWLQLGRLLRAIDLNYSVWIDWYERRIRGERAAFDIPGDKNRVEDKAILRRLAEATDEDFWGKGHEYVNATLKGWLDEARARVAPPVLAEASGILALSGAAEAELAPPQEPGAIAYGINDQGKLDRLPGSDQVHLRDVPDQRRAYQDLRDAATDLLDEGQRLGHRLKRALERFIQSLPERFEDAEAYLVWRDANALRRLHRAHREAAKSAEPDEAKLEPVIAEGLGGLLDLYNNFAFADDGLRAKDEARIAPQERAKALDEASAAAPLVTAILASPDIATHNALDDLAADAEDAKLPAGDPYADQVLDQANRTKRNWFAGLISDTWAAFKNANPLAQALVENGLYDGMKHTVTTVIGLNYAPLLDFIATHATALQSFAAVAFPTYPHLPELIERMKLYWQKLIR